MNLITLTNPQSAAAEAYRTLRTNLYFATLEMPAKTIVVTSPAPGEGKTTALANLAVVLAQAEKRVIVVDADLRHPSLHELFDVQNGRGLADMLADEQAVKDPPLCATAVPGLSVLTSGSVKSNPLDLLNSRRMAAIIAGLTTPADVVLFDAPPVMVASDAAILASQTDGVLLVVNIGKTRREQAQQARELLNRAHARLLGAVMLNAPQDRGLAKY
jgi:capsular exopolysaccharide synthesis family protein